jgi:hypothetical protein
MNRIIGSWIKIQNDFAVMEEDCCARETHKRVWVYTGQSHSHSYSSWLCVKCFRGFAVVTGNWRREKNKHN